MGRANEKPSQEEDELEIELGLASNCQSGFYEKSIEWIDLKLKLMSLDLVDDGSGVKNRLQRDPLGLMREAPILIQKHFKLQAKFWNSPVGQLSRIVFPIYVLIKYLALTYLQARYDELTKGNQVTGCIFGANNGTNFNNNSSSLVSVWRLQDLVGAFLTGTALSAAYPLLLLYPIALIFLAWLGLYFYVVRLEWLAFLFRPIEERRRVQAELDELVARLLGASRIQSREAVVQLVGDLSHVTCLTAAHLGHKWHKQMLRLTRCILTFNTISAVIIVILVQLNILFLISSQSLKTKLELIECRKWNPQANLAKWSRFVIDFDPKHYTDYDSSSWSHYFYLLVLVEPWYAFNWRGFLSWLETGLVAFLCSIWFSTWLTLYLMGVLNKLVWVWQINHQLDVCIRLIRDRKNEEQLILRATARAYLNYALFSLHYNSHKRLASFMSGQAIIVNLINLFTLSLAKKAANSSGSMGLYSYMAFTFVNFFLGLNGYFGSYSYLYRQVERVMWRISVLLADHERHRRRSIRLQFWMDLWRRSLLDESEMVEFYGLTLFTVQLDERVGAFKMTPNADEDELEIQLGLAENCRNELYERTMEWVDFKLKMMSLELTDDGWGVKNRLRRYKLWQPIEAPKIWKNSWLARLWNSRLGLASRILVPIYFLIKYLILSRLQMSYDTLLKRTQARTDANQCVLAPNANQTSLELASTWRLLDLAGSFLTDTPMSFVYPLMLLYPIALVGLGWICSSFFVMELDWLAFLCEPHKERHRVQATLDRLVKDLLAASRLQSRKLSLQLVAILSQVSSCKAAHLSHKWHRQMLHITQTILKSNSRSGILAAFLINMNILAIVLSQSLKTRLALIRCQKWDSRTGPARWSRFLVDSTLSKPNYELYATYDGSSWPRYLQLLVFIEPWYVFNWRSLIAWLETGLLAFLCAFWLTTWLTIYTMTVVNKIVWLNQINRQLEECIWMTRDRSIDEGLLLKDTAQVYLNYVLFKRQFEPQRRLASILAGQAALVNLINLLTVSLAKRSSSPPWSMGIYFYISFAFANFIINLNGYFGAYSYLYLQVERVMRRIDSLMASYESRLGGRKSARLEYWQDLWQRQLLDQRGLAHFYGLSLFTIQVSFANLVQVNVYPVAILAYLV